MFNKSSHALSAALLLAAGLCYAAGLATGAALLLGAGLALETWFWLRLARRADAQQESPGRPTR